MTRAKFLCQKCFSFAIASILGVLLSISSLSVSFAQPSLDETPNDTTTEIPLMKEEELPSTEVNTQIAKLIKSSATVSLIDATQRATETVGQNASAQASILVIDDAGFLVYRVTLVDDNGMMHLVSVDAGNGEILSHTIDLGMQAQAQSEGLIAQGNVTAGNATTLFGSNGG